MLQEMCAPVHYRLDEIEANQLESQPNPHLDKNFVEHLEIPEFTCLCPRSGFPDFATIIIDYVPDQYIVELQSFKFYINSYCNRQTGHESTPNIILRHLLDLLYPRWMRVVADFSIRGNIKTLIFVEDAQPSYGGPRPEYRRYLPSHCGNI